jgi:hypothetical protein
MIKPQIKLGILVVIIFQMGVIFYMNYAYQQLVTNQESYYNSFHSIYAKTLQAQTERNSIIDKK